jgi:AcrR family transcriptional regulator
MAEALDPTTARRASILEAATRVFLRYGFKKTSMDDLARAAGLSRQGLYLHFPTKEALFKEAVAALIASTRAAYKAALGRKDLDLPERLLAAFEAAHGHTIGQPGAENINELLEAATALVGPVVEELDRETTADIARALQKGGVAAAWKRQGLSANALAENLVSTSAGVKHRATSLAEYRDRMRIAVKIVCRGAE